MWYNAVASQSRKVSTHSKINQPKIYNVHRQYYLIRTWVSGED